MIETAFHIPKGAILFSEAGVSYEFRAHLGEGDHGLDLFLARKRTARGAGDTVILKCVGLLREGDSARILRARSRMEEEVRLATYLEHPGIVRVHGLHKAEGAWYVITERPEANSLSNLLTLAMEGDRCFSPSLVLYVGACVADVLHHAHTRRDERGRALGIVHRALSADRIFMDWTGRMRVADFGLALSSLPGRVASTVRRPRGDTYCASPEMLLGSRVDARSDLFSLGLVLLELATGNTLFDAPDGVPAEAKAMLSRSQHERVERAIQQARMAGCSQDIDRVIWRAATYSPEDVTDSTAGLPEPLRGCLVRLLQRSRAERFQTAEELAKQLRHGLGASFGAREAAKELDGFAAAGRGRLGELDMSRPGAGRRSAL